MIARDDLDLDPLIREVRQRLCGIGPNPFLEHDQGDRPHVGRQGLVLQRQIGAGHQQDPSAAFGVLGDPGGDRRAGRRGVEEDIGCAEQPGALIGERGTAPLAGRAERHHGAGDQPGVAGTASPMAARLALGRASVWGSAPRASSGASSPGTGSIEATSSARLGEGAGLVEADDVDPGEPLDGGQLLHQDPLAGQAHAADGEGDAGEQDQTPRG